MVNSIGSGVRPPEFKSQLNHKLCDLEVMHLSFLIYTMGTIKVSTLLGLLWELKPVPQIIWCCLSNLDLLGQRLNHSCFPLSSLKLAMCTIKFEKINEFIYYWFQCFMALDIKATNDTGQQ